MSDSNILQTINEKRSDFENYSKNQNFSKEMSKTENQQLSQTSRYQSPRMRSFHSSKFNDHQRGFYHNRNPRFNTYQTIPSYLCQTSPRTLNYGRHTEPNTSTPSLMSLEFPSEVKTTNPSAQQRSYSTRLTLNETKTSNSSPEKESVRHTKLNPSTPMNRNSQPVYYVDSFTANFSNQPTDKNSTTPKNKHVTFQDIREDSETMKQSPLNPDAEVYVAKSDDQCQMQDTGFSICRPTRSAHGFIAHNSYTNRYLYPRRYRGNNNYNWARSNWTCYPWSGYQQTSSQRYFLPSTRQLYDPNAPTTQTRREIQDSTNFLHHQTQKLDKSHSNSSQPNVDSSIDRVDSTPTIKPSITILRKPQNTNEEVSSGIVTSTVLVQQSSEQNPHQSVQPIEENEIQVQCDTTADLSDSKNKDTSILEDLHLPMNEHDILLIRNHANPIAVFNEASQQKKFSLTYQYTSTSTSSFLCTIIINDKPFPCPRSANSKSEAQKLACDYVLNLLYQHFIVRQNSSISLTDKHDWIAYRSMSTFQSLGISEQLVGRKTLAAILMVTDDDFSKADVISIGTGNTCLDQSALEYVSDGSAVHDCHAEVLARRGFIRFLFNHIRENEHKQTSILQYDPTTSKYKLADKVTFHLYTSSMPCGMASINIPSSSIRYKQGQTEGTTPPSSVSFEFPIKSCSDKICRWNVLGIQGGLLINFLAEPVYLKSITIACATKSDEEHIRNAFATRLINAGQSLSAPYRLNIPEIKHPTCKPFQIERQVAKVQTTAFAWNLSEANKNELLEPRTGRIKTGRLISTLSKQSFFKDFQQLIGDQQSMKNRCPLKTYQEAKQLDESYLLAKNIISNCFEQVSSHDQFPWLSKNVKLEQFSN